MVFADVIVSVILQVLTRKVAAGADYRLLTALH